MPTLSGRKPLLMALTLSLLSWGMTNPLTAEVIKLVPGDTIVFFGDSITQAGAGPEGYVTLVRQAIASKPKGGEIRVLGAGVSGNKVPDLEKRLVGDVMSHRPKVVVIYIGINDVWHSKEGRGTPKADFEAGLRRIIQQITKNKTSRVVLCTPSVIGEKAVGTNPMDAMLDEYAAITRAVAKETESPLIDLRKQFVEHLKANNKDDVDQGLLTTDGVHLNAAGNRFVADRMLEGLKITSADSNTSTAGKQLRHFVLFKFKDDVKPEQVAEVVQAFSALPSKIDTIIDFETGTDVSVEMKSEGYTHGFLVTFANEKGREIYLPHPAHKEFVKLVGPRVDKALVFDYWTK